MTNKYIMPATLLCDFYKTSHKDQYPQGTELIYSTWTPRSNKYFPYSDKAVAFGIQAFVKKYLVDYFNENFFGRPKEDVVLEYKRVLKFTLGIENPDASHIEELHDLGYLPVRLKAVKEGTLVPVKVPMLTIENTKPQFFWVTNYLETIISNEIWLPSTSATIAFEYRKILNEYAMKTVGNTDAVPFQGHDFSMRGMASLDASKASGAGHLLSFTGTDTIPAIMYHEEYYNADIEKELVGASIPATEHSTQSANANGQTDEYETFKRLITEVYPRGFVSIVSDTYDFWDNVGRVIPALKEEILARDGKVVIRPDSGDPVEIICGKNIQDLTGIQYVNTLEDAKDYMHDYLMEELRDETPHGEHGETEVYGEFKYQGKYYKIELYVEYDRYDKQYYYIDSHRVVKFEEFTPSLSDLGLIEALWDIFGGTVTEKGYKLLDSHIGAIYGDSITIERAKEICRRLEAKGFASINVVFGIGSYTYQYNTRDVFGFAMKATFSIVNGEERQIFKAPKTDNGLKKSQKGKVVVFKNTLGDITYQDELGTVAQDALADIDLLEDVFADGKLVRDESLQEIRTRLLNNL